MSLLLVLLFSLFYDVMIALFSVFCGYDKSLSVVTRETTHGKARVHLPLIVPTEQYV